MTFPYAPDVAAQELAERLHRIRGGLAATPGRATSRERAWANEFITDLLDHDWTPPTETT